VTTEAATLPAPRGKLPAELRDLCLHYGMRALPTGMCSGLGAWCGIALGRRAHPAADDRARALFAQLRPDLVATPEAEEASLRLLWRNVGRTYAEFAAIERMVQEGRTVLSDPQRLDEAYAGDRPLILCFVHLGNWEVLGQQVSTHPLIDRRRPVTAVIMPPTNRAHAHIAARRRASLPVDLVPMGRRVWHVVANCLRRPRGIVWLAGDEVANGRVFAPHFGRQPRIDGNLGKIVRLAAATGARVLPMYSERVGAAQFRSHILPMMQMPHGRLNDEEIRTEVMRIDAVFAPIVRRLLTQWYMAVEFGSDANEPITG
jgi:Kdo2-lipid IVA lauroyltransferase/acyltransferase